MKDRGRVVLVFRFWVLCKAFAKGHRICGEHPSARWRAAAAKFPSHRDWLDSYRLVSL